MMLLTLLPVSYFVASLSVSSTPTGQSLSWNVPLLAASVLIAGVALATTRALTDHPPTSPWLATAVIPPALATLHTTGLI